MDLSRKQAATLAVEVLQLCVSRRSQLPAGVNAHAEALNIPKGRRVRMSPREYFERIYSHAGCSTPVIITQMALACQLLAKGCVVLTSKNIHKLGLVCLVLAQKITDDFSRSNAEWARIGGITTEELNAAEVCFLRAVDFDIAVSAEMFNTVAGRLAAVHTAMTRISQKSDDSTESNSAAALTPSPPCPDATPAPACRINIRDIARMRNELREKHTARPRPVSAPTPPCMPPTDTEFVRSRSHQLALTHHVARQEDVFVAIT